MNFYIIIKYISYIGLRLHFSWNSNGFFFDFEWQQCYRLHKKGRGSHQFWLSWFLPKFIMNKWMKTKTKIHYCYRFRQFLLMESVKLFPLRRLDERIIHSTNALCLTSYAYCRGQYMCLVREMEIYVWNVL